uniref:Mediator complex subunit 4 n=1 Tax=Loa loa TaxID=7209 RepID=A0A1I7VAW0_LOALO
MSSNIIASIQPAKERLVNLLLEINSIELKSPEPDTTIEQQEILYTMRNRTLEDKLRRIQLCIKTLQSISDDWLKYTRTIASTKKEEKASEVITMGETGIYQTLQQGNEAIITLIMHKKDVGQKLIQLSKEKRKDVKSQISLRLPMSIVLNCPYLHSMVTPDNGDSFGAVSMQ